jgi:hypothetical protein
MKKTAQALIYRPDGHYIEIIIQLNPGRHRFIRTRRSREGGNPAKTGHWIPAFAGMTNKSALP